MGIYIKGMKMPENCIKCPMQFGGMCYVMPAEVDEGRVAPTVEEAWKQGKPDWCPLVEVPVSHGRLIDESKVRDAIYERLKVLQTHEVFMRKHGDIDLLGVLPYIDKIPTVIEGSEDA